MTVHDQAGFLESQGKILVTNGHSNVVMEFIFEFFSIDTSELQIDSEKCPIIYVISHDISHAIFNSCPLHFGPFWFELFWMVENI